MTLGILSEEKEQHIRVPCSDVSEMGFFWSYF